MKGKIDNFLAYLMVGSVFMAMCVCIISLTHENILSKVGDGGVQYAFAPVVATTESEVEGSPCLIAEVKNSRCYDDRIIYHLKNGGTVTVMQKITVYKNSNGGMQTFLNDTAGYFPLAELYEGGVVQAWMKQNAQGDGTGEIDTQ